jgi:hypothetical protein
LSAGGFGFALVGLQLPHDGFDDAGVGGLHTRGKGRGEVSLATDQILVKIPARNVEWAL